MLKVLTKVQHIVVENIDVTIEAFPFASFNHKQERLSCPGHLQLVHTLTLLDDCSNACYEILFSAQESLILACWWSVRVINSDELSA